MEWFLRGNLCIKGKYGYDFVEAADRIREPQDSQEALPGKRIRKFETGDC